MRREKRNMRRNQSIGSGFLLFARTQGSRTRGLSPISTAVTHVQGAVSNRLLPEHRCCSLPWLNLHNLDPTKLRTRQGSAGKLWSGQRADHNCENSLNIVGERVSISAPNCGERRVVCSNKINRSPTLFYGGPGRIVRIIAYSGVW